MITTILIWTLVIALFALGTAGAVLPVIPGTPLIFLGALIYGFWTDFEEVGAGTLVTLSILTLAAIAIDFIAQAYGTKKYGATKLSQALTLLGAIIGVFTGLWGVFVFPVIGAIIGELISGKDINQATKSGFGAFIGFLGGGLTKIILSFIMIGIFFVAVIG